LRASTNAGRQLLALCGVLLVIVGCKSSGQTDLVEREMRQQEDQIYAMQDYLNNYQQLLCQARAENESLKQQLGEGQSTASSPSLAPKSEPGKSRLKPPPHAPTPPSRQMNGPQLGEPETPPVVPKLEMGNPDVPPLRDTSAQDGGRFDDDSETIAAAADRPESVVQRADYESPIKKPTNTAPANVAHKTPVDQELPASPEQPRQVLLQGQVVAGDADNCPHVLVDVTPQLADGQPVDYRGSLSLLILDPYGEGSTVSLARWDFTADELDQTVLKTTDGPTLEFPLQLPSGVPIDKPLELWARLLPENGKKILTHATLDLSRASQFSSAEQPELPIVERALQIVDSSVSPGETPQSTVRETGWQVARPDQPTFPQPRRGTSSSGWRTATEAIPMAESVSTRIDSPPAPQALARSQEPPHPSGRAAKVAGRNLPEWSPERADDAKATVPAWAPTR
jgi:hypothetical protein